MRPRRERAGGEGGGFSWVGRQPAWRSDVRHAQLSPECDERGDQAEEASEIAGVVNVGDAREGDHILHPDLFCVDSDAGECGALIKAKPISVAGAARRRSEGEHDPKPAQPRLENFTWREVRY